jgi:hypothetical protein
VVHSLSDLGGLSTESAKAQILLNAQSRQRATAFWYVDQSGARELVAAPAGDVTAIELDIAGCRPNHPRDGTKHGALAGTVRSEHRHQLAW